MGIARWWAAAVLAVALWSGPALAVVDADRTTAQDMISRQIEAFRRDDGEAAFGLASPGIRGIFGSADQFLDMVRRNYGAVHHPRTFSFGPTRDLDEGFEQLVMLQDEGGVDWDAVYSFERQPDGSWRISGCRLVKRPGEAV